MSDKPKNALAELANEIERLAAENKDLFSSRNHLVLYKAQRIVKELAGVQSEPYQDCVQAYYACRAIAEEGANHGND